MSRRPRLTAFPHLHNVMRNDPMANQEFSAYLNALQQLASPGADVRAAEELDNALENLQRQIEKNKQLTTAVTKMSRFIQVLGSVMEPQVHLSPYTVDVAEKKTYEIKFSADQVRYALRYYWEAVAQKMEDTIETTAGGPDLDD